VNGDPSALAHLDPKLRQILDRLPREPGVYLLKDGAGTIVYVGKAINLFSRVRSYFSRSTGDTRAFVPLLERLVGDVETIVTRNEKEALLLENNLIKRHKPRFNVMLRDDKSYLVLRLDHRAAFPRLEVTRRIRDDGARYFGPYHSATACRQTLRLVNRHFQLRTCTDRTMHSRKRPCLQHQIQRCPAPCMEGLVSEALYAQQVRDVTLFLRGRGAELIGELEQRMSRSAERLEYELAARLRDQLAALRAAQLGQQVVGDSLLDQDVIGFYREGDRVDLVVLLVREGKVVGRRPFSLSGQELPDDELLSGFVARYYDRAEELQSLDAIPRQVLLPLPLEDREVKAQWLAELRGGPVEILVPQRGEKRKLLELCQRNARSNFQTRRQRDSDDDEALAKLQRRLRLTRTPVRMECFDVSGFQGQLVVASMVVLERGQPQRAAYRRFKIQSENKDDFASMYEVLCRRLRRARRGDAGWELPDLIVVDGGKAQLSMALTALRDVGLPPGAAAPDMVGLAKEREIARDDDEPEVRPERVYLPRVKDPIALRPRTAEFFLMTRIRDEAHRFAITFHKELRRKRALRSGLEEIPGIGPKRRKELLKALGSLKRIRSASAQELAAVPSMTSRAAEAVARYFAAGDGGAGEGTLEAVQGAEAKDATEGEDGVERT
jgi:excinuclease ABC subunit C